MMNTGQKIKESFLIGTLNIGLPTADVYSDVDLMYTLYTGVPTHPRCETWAQPEDPNALSNITLTIDQICLSNIPEEELTYENQPIWATWLLVPILLNYIAGWWAWYRADKKKNRTWLACLLGVYPQLRAASIIKELWKDPMRGQAKKRKFDRGTSEAEVFLEAIPSSCIMSYIFGQSGTLNNIRNPDRRNMRVAAQLCGNNFSTDYWKFLFTFLTSLTSASLGMAKVLKVSNVTDTSKYLNFQIFSWESVRCFRKEVSSPPDSLLSSLPASSPCSTRLS